MKMYTNLFYYLIFNSGMFFLCTNNFYIDKYSYNTLGSITVYNNPKN